MVSTVFRKVIKMGKKTIKIIDRFFDLPREKADAAKVNWKKNLER